MDRPAKGRLFWIDLDPLCRIFVKRIWHEQTPHRTRVTQPGHEHRW